MICVLIVIVKIALLTERNINAVRSVENEVFKMRRDCDSLRRIAEIERRHCASSGVRYEVERMRCLNCGGNYIGMKTSHKYKCPHCGDGNGRK